MDHPIVASAAKLFTDTKLFRLVMFLAAAAWAGNGLAAPSASEALTQLREGNARFLAGKSVHPHQDTARRAEIVQGQTPIATVLSCSDSRVAAELIFDQGLGDIFVVRVAGNVADTDEIGSIEYGVGHLNTPVLIVVGHIGCGAVKAVMEDAQVHGSIPALIGNIAPAVVQARAANPGTATSRIFDDAVKANVWISIGDIFAKSEEVRERVKVGKLEVVGAVYDLSTGAVNWLGAHPEQATFLASVKEDAHISSAGDAAAGKTVHAPEQTGVNGSTTSAAQLSRRHLLWVLGVLAATVVALAASWFLARAYMPRLKVPQRLATGFVAVLLVLGAVGFVGYEGLHNALKGFREYRTDARHSVLGAAIEVDFFEMRIAVKDYQIKRTAAEIEEFENHRKEITALLEQAHRELHESERQKIIATLQRQVADYIALFSQMANAPSNAVLAPLGKRMAEAGDLINHELQELQKGIVADQNLAGPRVDRAMSEAQTAIISIAAGAVILGLFLAWIISRSIVAPLREIAGSLATGAQQTVAASGQISAASQDLAAGASEQAASIEETSASLEELSSMTLRNAENAQQAKEAANQTRTSADDGAHQVKAMQDSMHAINNASQAITKILKTIDDIAFQTNILALNAAVEAARAGDAGAGFAVVAEEVRALAQRSATAAKETSEKIGDSVAKSEQGVHLSAEVATSFATIQKNIHQLNTLAVEIATASNEQSQGLTQISTAVAQMDKVTQTNAAGAEEAAGAAEELNAQAVCLKDAVDRMYALVGASDSSRATDTLEHATPALSNLRPVVHSSGATAKPPASSSARRKRSTITAEH